MQRHQLQHVILESGRRFDLPDFYVVGSAAILAALPDPPAGTLTATRDVDVSPPNDDEQLADRISFVLGEASDFDITSMTATAFASFFADVALIQAALGLSLVSSTNRSCPNAAYIPAARSGRNTMFQLRLETTLGKATNG